MAKASIFIITNQLQDKRYIGFNRLLKTVDTRIIKEFINSVIQKIVVKSGRIVIIRFKNGLEYKFLYKNKI